VAKSIAGGSEGLSDAVMEVMGRDGSASVMGSQQAARAHGLKVRPSYLYKFSYLCICNFY